MARTLLLILILLAALTGAAWWLLSPEDAPGLRPGDEPGPNARDVAAAGGSTVSGAADGQRADRASAPVQRGSAPPEIAPDAEWTTLTIVDETDTPVADAEVDWVFGIEELFGEDFGEDQVEAYAAEHGRHARSDADGRVRVVTGDNSAWIYARKGERWGYEGIWAGRTPPPGGFRLVIRPDVTFAVMVKDADGEPAQGVPLVLVLREDRGAALAWAAHVLRTTGDDGLAVWPHAQSQARFGWGAKAGKPVPWWEIAIAAPGLEAPSLWLQPHTLPAEPPVLQLPPTGHLRVHATVGGRPEPDTERMWLTNVGDSGRQPLRTPVDRSGTAEFRHLPLGKQFQVGRSNWSFEVDGPTAPGEWREVTFDLSQRLVLLAGRLLDEQGQPFADSSYWIEWKLDAKPGSSRMTTTADGRFLATLREPSDDDAPLQLEQFRLRRIGDDAQRGELPAQMLVRGVNDVGDVRLQRPPLVASGRFDCDCDRRLRAWVEVQFYDANHQNPWSAVGGLSVEVHDDRTFEVRGDAPAAPLRLILHVHDMLSPPPFEFRNGDRDLVVPVQCGSALLARCTLPDGVMSNELQASLRAEGMPWQPATNTWPRNPLIASCWPGEDGSHNVSWPALPSGTYTLAVGLRSVDGPVLEVHDVVVPPPEGGDPRLADLDLRAAVSTIQLKLDIEPDRDGKVRPNAIVFLLPQARADEWSGTLIWERHGALPVPPGPHDLLVTMRGRRPVELRAVQGSATAALRRWPELDLQFAGADALPADAKLLVRVDRPQPTTQRRLAGGLAGTVEDLLAPTNDPVEVVDDRATVMLDEGTERLIVEVAVGEQRRALQQVAPREVMAGSLVTVQLSAAEVAAAIAALRGK
ncbi:MAG: hypothetical protein R3F29_08605 [Planctomycetota bacterium]